MIDRHDLRDHHPELAHLTRGALLAALSIDPTHNPQPTRSLAENLALLQATVEAERAAVASASERGAA